MLHGDHIEKEGIKHLAFSPDTLRGAMAAVRKRQSMTSSTATAAGAVPRSTSQPGNCRAGLISNTLIHVLVLVSVLRVDGWLVEVFNLILFTCVTLLIAAFDFYPRMV